MNPTSDRKKRSARCYKASHKTRSENVFTIVIYSVL